MRVLFSSMRMIGHIRPLFPYAHALLKGGHDVLVAAPQDAGAIVRDAGLEHAAFGHPGDSRLAEISRLFATMAPEDIPKAAVREIFVGLNAPAALPGLRSIIGTWKPDVIVRESMEFGASVAAAEAGLPTARVGSSNRQAEADVVAIASDPLDAFRRQAGLEPDGGASLRAELSFAAFPPSLDGDMSFAGLRTPLRTRTTRESPATEAFVPSWAVEDGRPLVFITFGTLAAGAERNHRLFRMAIEAVGALRLSGPCSRPGQPWTSPDSGTFPKTSRSRLGWISVRSFHGRPFSSATGARGPCWPGLRTPSRWS